MFAGIIQRLTSVALWGSLCALFSLFVSSGAVVLGALILVMMTGVIAVMLGPQFIAASWLIGSPTIFGFPNEILRALPFVTMERLLVFVLVVMVFLQFAFSKRKTRWLPLEVTMLVFLIYALVSLALHTSELRYRNDGWLWIQYLLPMAAFIVGRRLSWSDKGLRILLAALTVTGVFVAITGILQSRFGINLFTMNYQTITAGHTSRAYGTFTNSHTFVASLFMYLTISLLQFTIHKDSFVRFALVMAMAIIAVGIILGASRGPWIGAALAFLIIYTKHRQARQLLVIGGVIGIIAGTIIFATMIEHLDGFINRVMNIGTLQGRAAVWATAVNMIVHNPLFGVGFGSTAFAIHKPEYIIGIGSLSAQYAVYLGIPHNEYLHVAVMLGIIGLVLFLMILVRTVKLMFRIFRDQNQNTLRRHFALYIGAIIIALMFNSFFSDTFVQDYFWVLAFFLAGIAAGAADEVADQAERGSHGGSSIATAD